MIIKQYLARFCREMGMDTIRVGFIGCGRHSGMRLYPGLETAGLELIAVCDMDEQKARARAARHNVAHVYTDYRRMCDEQDLDAVLVVTGPRGHYELTRELLERGYPVWTEKPCSETSSQADELVALADQAERHVQTGFNYRYTMGMRRAVDMIESGRFAEPSTVSVRWYLGEPDTVRFMQHYVCHAVDLLHFMTPGGLTHLDPSSADALHVEYQRQYDQDWYLITFRAVSGAISVLELAAHMSGEGHHCRVDLMSSDGLLSVVDFTQTMHYETAVWGDMRTPDSKVYDGDRIWRTEPLLRRGSLPEAYGYAEEFIRFREAIQGLRKPEATVREATWGMHIMDRLLRIAGKES